MGVLHSRTDRWQREAMLLILGTAIIVSLTQVVFYVKGRHHHRTVTADLHGRGRHVALPPPSAPHDGSQV